MTSVIQACVGFPSSFLSFLQTLSRLSFRWVSSSLNCVERTLHSSVMSNIFSDLCYWLFQRRLECNYNIFYFISRDRFFSKISGMHVGIRLTITWRQLQWSRPKYELHLGCSYAADRTRSFLLTPIISYHSSLFSSSFALPLILILQFLCSLLLILHFLCSPPYSPFPLLSFASSSCSLQINYLNWVNC